MRISGIVSWISAAILFLAVLLFLPSAGQCDPCANSPPAIAVEFIIDNGIISAEPQNIKISQYSAAFMVSKARPDHEASLQYVAGAENSLIPDSPYDCRCFTVIRQRSMALESSISLVNYDTDRMIGAENSPTLSRVRFHRRT